MKRENFCIFYTNDTSCDLGPMFFMSGPNYNGKAGRDDFANTFLSATYEVQKFILLRGSKKKNIAMQVGCKNNSLSLQFFVLCLTTVGNPFALPDCPNSICMAQKFQNKHLQCPLPPVNYQMIRPLCPIFILYCILGFLL